ncbi:MAG: 4Fe-4S binding protein [Proteobacteria bacterium]|nr:4Fe-4S binding protein [Pseudomonadota bacterium]
MRSRTEQLFIIFFIPCVIGFYLIYKYPQWFVSEDSITDVFYFLGKSTSFWYASLYTSIVCGLAGWVVWQGKTPYGKDPSKPLSRYQKHKFISIFFAQLIFFYLIPFIVPDLLDDKPFFADEYSPLNKDAYVYVYNGFTSLGGFFYVFLLVPLSVWFFGKRYCSWFCACGNLAEVIGVTKWGNRWVQEKTPRSNFSKKAEWLQYGFLVFAILFGLVLFFHAWHIIIAPSWLESMREIQDLAVDLAFGALIGIGAYPFLGTRIWCRYGCPLAGLMRLFGKFSRSKFAVVASPSCKGLNLCSTQCPMGIDVASYAHKDGHPIEGQFGLNDSPCIGCGGCVDICPVKALSFQKILNPQNTS